MLTLVQSFRLAMIAGLMLIGMACSDLSVFVSPTRTASMDKITEVTVTPEGLLQLSWKDKNGAPQSQYQIYLRNVSEDAERFSFSSASLHSAPLTQEPLSLKSMTDKPKYGELIGSTTEHTFTFPEALLPKTKYLLEVGEKGRRRVDEAILVELSFSAFEATSAVPMDGAVQLIWDEVPGANRYEVYADAEGKILLGTSTEPLQTIKIDPANPLTNYYVRAFRGQLAAPEIVKIEFKNSGVHIQKIVSKTPNGKYTTSDVLEFEVYFSDKVNLFGTSKLPLLVKNKEVKADYVSGNGTNVYTYRYVIQAGDDTTDLQNGTLLAGDFVDVTGLAVSAALPILGTYQSLGEIAELVIDTTPPTSPANVGFSSAISMTGDLNVSFSASEDLYFAHHNVKLCANSDCQTACGSTKVLTGTTQPFAGLAEGSFYACVQGEDTTGLTSPWVSSMNASLVDKTVPSVVKVMSVSADGRYKEGDSIEIAVEFSEPVFVVLPAQVSLKLETGSIDRDALYSSGSGSKVLKFIYTASVGDNSQDLNYQSPSALSKGTGSLKDAAGNDAHLMLPMTNHANALAEQSAIIIDTLAPVAATAVSFPGTTSSSTSLNLSWTASSDLNFKTHRVKLCQQTDCATGCLSETNVVSSPTTLVGADATSYFGCVQGEDHLGHLSPWAASGSSVFIDTSVPTIEYVSSSTANGIYDVGATINVQIKFSETVFVTNDAALRLQLETGATDASIAMISGDGTDTLTFQYTVQAGDRSIDLNYASTSALSLNGATIQDATGNNAVLTLPSLLGPDSLSGRQALRVDTANPTDPSTFVLATTSNTPNFSVSWTASNDDNFEEHEVKTCSSNDCTTSCSSVSQVSGASTLLTGVHGSSYYVCARGKDQVGRYSAWVSSSNAIAIDTAAPTVTSVTSPTANATYKNTDAISISVQFSENVIVSGDADVRLLLETGLVDRFASYSSGSGTNTLLFSYTVQNGDASQDLDYESLTALNLGATGAIRDSSGNAATLTLPALGGPQSLAGQKSIKVDTTSPTNPVTPSFSSSLTNSATIPLSWTASTDLNFLRHNVKLCTANDCSTACISNGTSVASPTNLTGANGGTYFGCVQGEDESGHVSAWVSTGSSILVDTTVPFVTDVTSSTANGSYKEGATVDILVTFNEIVQVTLPSELSVLMETGATDRVAPYISGSGSTTLLFRYTVAANDTSSDLDYVATNSLVVGAGAIKDTALSDANLTLPAPGDPASIAPKKAIIIDTTAPLSPSITDPAVSAFKTSNVTVISGTSEANATVAVREGATTLGTTTSDGLGNWTYTLATPLSDGTYTIRARATDLAGNISVWSAAQTFTVDTSAPLPPVITTLTTPSTDQTPTISGTSEAGMAIELFAGAVSVGTITADGSGNWSITASSLAEGTHVMTATATDAGPRTSAASSPVNLNIDLSNPSAPTNIVFPAGATTTSTSIAIQWDASTDINFKTHQLKLCTSNDCATGCTSDSTSVASPSTLLGVDSTTYYGCVRGEDELGHLSAWVASSATIGVSTTEASIISLSATPSSAYRKLGDTVDIVVTFSKPITVTNGASITLKLETGTTDRDAVYLSNTGSTITFRYTVGVGDTSSDLNYHSINALSLGGTGQIKDVVNADASIILPPTGGGSSLAGSNAVIVDTTAPTNPSSVGFSGTVSGSTSVNVSWSASTDANFDTHNVKLCENSDCSTNCGAVSQSAGTSLSLTGTNGTTYHACVQGVDDAGHLSSYVASIGTMRIDTSAPTVLNVSSTKANGYYKIGESIDITVRFSESVYVTNDSDIKLLLETGATDRQAEYTSGSGTDTLIFTYIVQANDTSSDLDYASTSALTRTPSGTINDAAGNAATLTLPLLASASSIAGQKAIVVDTTLPPAPVITSPAANAFETSAVTTISGTSESNATINVMNGATLLGTVAAVGTNWTLTLGTSLSIEGNYTLTATATDLAGNLGPASAGHSFTIDTTPPLAPTITTYTSPVNDSTPTLSGTSEANMTITLYANGVSVGTATANGSGNWSVTASTLVDGTYTMTARATDAGSRQGPASPGVTQVIDTTAPQNPSAVAFTSAHSNTTLQVTWTASTDTNLSTHNVKLCSTSACNVSCTAPITSASPATLAGVSGTTYYACVQGVDTVGLVSSWVASAGTGTIDTAAPTVFDVTSSTANGYYSQGSVIDIEVEFTETVVVTTPAALGLQLETGATDRIATYLSGSGTDTLVFRYTVQANDISADLQYFATNSLTVGAGSIRDLASNNATLTLPALGDGHSLGIQKAIVVDTTVPSAPASVGFSGSYSSSPTFNMSWTNSADTNFLTHNVKICTANDCSTGCTSAATSVSTPAVMTGVNGTTYYGCVQGQDRAGLTSSFVASAATMRVDTSAATVAQVTSTHANGSYSVGISIPISVRFNETVVVTNGGDLRLRLATGGAGRDATYTSGSNSDTLIFTYTVQASDISADLDYANTTALSLGAAGQIRDLAGNASTLTLPSPGAVNSLGHAKAIVIDTAAPPAPSITTPTNGFYSTTTVASVIGTSESGASIKLYDGVTQVGTATASGINWTVNVSPVLGNGSHSLTATATDAAGNESVVSSTITFTVDTTPPNAPVITTTGITTNDNTPTITGTSEPNMSITVYLGGSTSVATTTADAGGNWSVATSTLADGSRSITAKATDQGAREGAASNAVVFTIDTVAPTVVSVNSATANATYGISASIAVQVTFSENVTFSYAAPQSITMETGTTDASVVFSSGSGTPYASGAFVVASGYSTADLDYQSASALTGTYTDAAGNTAVLTLPAPGAANSLGANKAIVIDGVPATITNVTSTKTNGKYAAAAVIDIQVTFSRVVNVASGTPTLTLNTTPTTRYASYASGSGSTVLTFNYTIQATDVAADLNATAVNLAGATIRDVVSNNAVLTMPTSGATGSLNFNKNIQVAGNNVAPNLTATPSSQNAFTGVAITSVDVNDSSTSNDIDGDGDAITYTCRFDNTVNSAMDSGGTDCASLPNTAVSFNASTGVLTWTPSVAATVNRTAAREYEFRVTGTDVAAASANRFFTVNVLQRFSDVVGFDAGDAASYTYDTNQIEYTAGVARLLTITNNDIDGTALGFGGGTQLGTKWYSSGGDNFQFMDTNGGCDPKTLACANALADSWVPQPATATRYSFDSGFDGFATVSGKTLPTRSAAAAKGGATGLLYNQGTGGTQFAEMNLTAKDTFSISFWFKSTQSYVADGCVDFWNGTGLVSSEAAYWVHDWGITMCDGYIIGGVGTGGTDINLKSPLRYNNGVWHHVAFTRNKTNGNVHLYIDGMLITTGTGNTNTLGDNPKMMLGAHWADGPKYDGSMDELIVWTGAALTHDEVLRIYERQATRYSGLQTSRVMDYGSSTTWTSLKWKTMTPFGKSFPDYSGSVQNEATADYPDLQSTTWMANAVGSWNFDETSAAGPPSVDYEDGSGQGNGALGNSMPQLTSSHGRVGRGLRFDGTGHVRLGSGTNWNIPITTPFTVSLWFRTHGGAQKLFVSQSDYRANGIDLMLDTDGGVLFGIGCGSRPQADCVYVATNTKGFNDGGWHHVVAMHDRTYNVLKIFMNGAPAAISKYGAYGTCAYTNGSTEIKVDTCTYLNSTRSLSYPQLGMSGQSTQYFTGFMDEVAVWTKRLNNGEVEELFRRGGNRLFFQVRSCTTADCSTGVWKGPDGTSQTFFSEFNNNTAPTTGQGTVKKTLPTMTFSDFGSLGLATGRYFQYRTLMESDDYQTRCNYGSNRMCSPELISVEVGPSVSRYSSQNPSITYNIALPFYTIGGAGATLSETATCAGGARYNLSLNGTSWYYWTGAAWALSNSTYAQASSIATINSNAASFATSVGRGNLYVRAYLGSNGAQTCSIDAINIQGNYNY